MGITLNKEKGKAEFFGDIRQSVPIRPVQFLSGIGVAKDDDSVNLVFSAIDFIQCPITIVVFEFMPIHMTFDFTSPERMDPNKEHPPTNKRKVFGLGNLFANSKRSRPIGMKALELFPPHIKPVSPIQTIIIIVITRYDEDGDL
mmetsp:Transcript_41527/g.58439  ORF Transcript_41527/g.58439 Transcript_41527/m.58439 type:complete len:144 (-) Transcript_41527:164-595(-)